MELQKLMFRVPGSSLATNTSQQKVHKYLYISYHVLDKFQQLKNENSEVSTCLN